ncbi:MAG: Ig-like domain-containing protein [Inhella sp.]|uniref:Ig-like domain-containing protein n=1 Tax=Inhella sp. TaxID=1921806 RepID=UPI0022BB5277|nr:Ig-like domain-containing protein [Inhella sp.]MCZ8234699.1 hypothetical protein [Inhella sp.]
MKTLKARSLAALLMAATLVACGGGGGSAGTPSFPPGGGGDGGGGQTKPAATVSVALSSATVTAASPATVTVTVLNRAGAGLPGKVVVFSSPLGLGKFSAPSALTNANGVATVQLSPVSATATGADTVVAKVAVDETEFSGNAGFQLTATNVTLTSFTSDLGGGALSAYGQTGLTVVLGNTTAGVPVNVVVTSNCVSLGKATLTPASVSTSTGRAVFTYRDNGCGAAATSDALQASITGTTATSNLNLSLTQPAVSSIAFVSASPDTIYLKGSGYVENSTVKFRVVDANGNGVPQQSVSFAPTTLAGGLLVDGQSGTFQKLTDTNGEVTVRVNAGTVPTPVRIRATLVGSSISTVSSNLSIAVGLPSQLNFSLSQGTINIEGYDYDGTANTYTIIASDRLGNPVPEGTSVNFVAEGGQIQAIRQSTVVNGLSTITANYLSSAPKPLDGRITVLAYALGEKSFLDANGNNVYDSGEDYQDLGDVFLDRLYNFGGREKGTAYGTPTNPGRFDPSTGFNAAEDQVISLGYAGSSACVASASSLLDLSVSIPVKPSTCSVGWGQAYVRRATETVLSRSTPRMLYGTSSQVMGGGVLQAASAAGCPRTVNLRLFYDGSDTPQTIDFYVAGSGGTFYNTGTQGAFSLIVADSNPVAYNPMPAGTIVAVQASSGLTPTLLGGSPVPSTSYPTGLTIGYKFDDTTTTGSITVTTTSPRGVGTVATTINLVKDAASGTVVTCP